MTRNSSSGPAYGGPLLIPSNKDDIGNGGAAATNRPRRRRPPDFAPSSETPGGYVGQAVLESLSFQRSRTSRNPISRLVEQEEREATEVRKTSSRRQGIVLGFPSLAPVQKDCLCVLPPSQGLRPSSFVPSSQNYGGQDGALKAALVTPTTCTTSAGKSGTTSR
jgi:hypothetical protein